MYKVVVAGSPPLTYIADEVHSAEQVQLKGSHAAGYVVFHALKYLQDGKCEDPFSHSVFIVNKGGIQSITRLKECDVLLVSDKAYAEDEDVTSMILESQ